MDAAPAPVPVPPYLSSKLRVVTLIAVLGVLVVHAYNLNSRFVAGENGPESPGAPGVVGFVEYLGSQALTRWPAAMLFAVSGFLFFRNLEPAAASYLRKYRRRLRTLVVPFLLWSAWGLVVYVVLREVAVARGYLPDDVGPLSAVGLLERWLLRPVPYPLWFLQALIVCMLVAPALYWLVRWLRLAAPLVFVPLWLLDQEYTNYLNFKALMAFTLGAAVAVSLRYHAPVPWQRLRDGAPAPAGGPAPGAVALGRVLLPAWVACCVVYAALLRGEDAFWANMLHKGLMLMAMAAVWYGYDAYLRGLARRPVVVWLLPFTFFIFVAQEPTLMMVKRALLKALGRGDAAVLTVYVAAPLITLGLCVAVAALLRRHAPRFYGLVTGSR